ncbi:hypothetical protein E2C01_062542 [Portunus trituberculatus]|uniref:Uncharacterized protein n=1 Tax=Portunus trituberculatus TaxID=210409 RepID=A0A5B7HBE6_PORTR|nr:hypothetical protein [Portunus trituberculatus]
MLHRKLNGEKIQQQECSYSRVIDAEGQITLMSVIDEVQVPSRNSQEQISYGTVQDVVMETDL